MQIYMKVSNFASLFWIFETLRLLCSPCLCGISIEWSKKNLLTYLRFLLIDEKVRRFREKSANLDSFCVGVPIGNFVDGRNVHKKYALLFS